MATGLTITVDIDSANVQRVLDAFCTDRWTETITDADGKETKNPESREDFVSRTVGYYVNQVVTDYERQVHQKAAEAAAADIAPVVADPAADNTAQVNA